MITQNYHKLRVSGPCATHTPLITPDSTRCRAPKLLRCRRHILLPMPHTEGSARSSERIHLDEGQDVITSPCEKIVRSLDDRLVSRAFPPPVSGIALALGVSLEGTDGGRVDGLSQTTPLGATTLSIGGRPR